MNEFERDQNTLAFLVVVLALGGMLLISWMASYVQKQRRREELIEEREYERKLWERRNPNQPCQVQADGDVAEKLEKLEALLRSGTLTPAEYAVAKSRLLSP